LIIKEKELKENEKQNSKPNETAKVNNNQNKQGHYNRRRRYHKYRRPFKTTERISFKKISIVIPLLDEEESIRPLLNEINKALLNKGIQYEVLFIDDGSMDKSLKIIKEMNAQNKKVKYYSFQKNYGKSAALQIGFKQATGDAIITMDADLQDDPSEIMNLLRKLDEGYDLVSGWKKKRQDPLIKKISSRFFNFITRVMTGIKIHDFNCGLKAYRKDVVKNIKVYGELHRYVPVLAKWKGYRISEINVKHHPRRYGKTKFGISRFFKGFIDLITVLFATRYIKRPMHFFGFLGAFSFIIGLLVNGYLTYQWIIGIPLSNRPMLFLGMLLIIVGVQFFSIGLLGEILVHNSMDEKEYLIKDKG